MSYSTLFVFRANGFASNYEEFRNGWGSAPRVWDALVDKYKSTMYPDRMAKDMEYVNGLSNCEDLCNKAEDGSLPLLWWEMNLLHWTYDRCYLKREDFALMIASITQFERAFPAPNRVDHLPKMASILRILLEQPDVQGVGYWHTSVTDNPWSVRLPEDAEEEDRAYDLNIDSEHYVIPMLSAPESTP